MHSNKKMTKEDTWRSEELMRHMQRSKQREMERDRLEEDRRTERREEQERERRRREREREKERYTDGDKQTERRNQRSEKESRDREKEKQRERYKDRERHKDEDVTRHRERDREKDGRRERDKDRQTEREREREKGRERNKERDGEGDRKRERGRESGEKDKESHRKREGERERRRDVQDRERTNEKERRKEREASENAEDKHREKEREKERRERHKAREGVREDRREGEKREKHDHRDREERRERRREKERHEAGEHARDVQETERPHPHRDREKEKERTRDRERDKHKESHRVNSKPARDEDELESEILEENDEDTADNAAEVYEDDFEVYEEDFEEEEEEEEEAEVEVEKKEREEYRALSPRRRREVEAIQRAIEEENKRISAAHSPSSTSQNTHSSQTRPAHTVSGDAESEQRKGRTQGRVMDFVAARQRQADLHNANLQKKRSAELSQLIDLDFSLTATLLDLPSVSEYELYIKSFGTANTKQAYVQCNEDSVDRGVQTEEVETLEKWAQHPAESSVVCGGPQYSHDPSGETTDMINVDSKRLNTFLLSAAQVIAVLLEEERAEISSVEKPHSQTHSLSFSDGCVQLNTQLPILQGRQVTMLHFSKVQVNSLLSVHAPRCDSATDALDTNTLLCVWNIWETSTPQRVLLYEGQVLCCCFGPGKPTLVFAGTAVGSVLLWDLREASSGHLVYRAGQEEWTLRFPTFSTDAVLSEAGHVSSVLSVEPVPVSVRAGLTGLLLPEADDGLGWSFLLGSLDESGLLNLWVVVELSKDDDSGSQTDLGLRPGGRVKLLHSSSLHTCSSSTPREVTPQSSLLLRFLPSHLNHYIVGTGTGLVCRGTRHAVKAVPAVYRPRGGAVRPVEVTALECCPSGEPFFLVGCSDGTVRLHSVQCEDSVLEWTAGSGAAVLSVQWCPSRVSVFCTLDAASVLHVWDLEEKDSAPLVSQQLHADRVTAMAVWGDALRPSSPSGMALARRSDRVELHYLKPSLSSPRASDNNTLLLLAHNAL